MGTRVHARSLRALLALLVLATLSLAAAGDAERWWAHIKFLADDSMQGRETGSEGHRKAAVYIASHFEKVGLSPAGTRGFMQPVSFRSQQIIEGQSSLALVRDGKVERLVLGDDAYFNVRVRGATKVNAPLVFAGYALTVPEAEQDDLAGLDLKGKVVVHFGGGPANVPGPLLAHYQNAAVRWEFLKRAGAIGTIAVRSPIGQDVPWDRAKQGRLRPALALADAEFDDTPGQQLSVTFNTDSFAKLLAGTGRNAAEIIALAAARKPLPTFALPSSVQASWAVEAKTLEADNVVGVLPGSDPTLKNEIVVATAHLDHLGIGEPINGDRIYNGAMDDASGIATLIETAAAIKNEGKPLRRTVAFVAVTAEEHGLLGSRYFAVRPSLPKGSRIVADLNVDMFLPLFPLKSIIAQGLEESDLAADLRRLGGAAGLRILSDPEPERNAFVRSDQYSFIRQGVPALSLKVGFDKGSPEHEIVIRWRKERYHAPSDDLNQPVDMQSAVDFNRVFGQLIQAVANRDSVPRWNNDSFFRRFAR